MIRQPDPMAASVRDTEALTFTQPAQEAEVLLNLAQRMADVLAIIEKKEAEDGD